MIFHEQSCLYALRVIACVALLFVCPGPAVAEDTVGRGGFLLSEPGAGAGVTAAYRDDASIEYLHRSTDLQREDFIPLARLHEHNVEDVVYFYGEVIDADDFLELAKVQSLRGIEVGFYDSADDYASIEGDIAKLGVIKQVESVSLNIAPIKDDDLSFVAALPRLTCLAVNVGKESMHSRRTGPGCTDRCAEHLAKAAGIEVLLIHDGMELTDRFVDRLTATVRKLKELECDSPLLTDESLRLLSERCPDLEYLSLRSERLTDAGFLHLLQLRNLRRLWMDSPVSVETVALMTTLREVVLVGCHVSDRGAESLANLRDLERLVLYGPEMTDKQFGYFRGHPALKAIILNGRHLTRDSTLRVLGSMPRLKEVSFVENEELEQAAESALKQRAVEP